jgi:DNA-binding CsgD family transcriptional regulator
MLQGDRLLALVGRIYDATADRVLWPAVLEDFAGAFDSSLAGLMHYDLPAPHADWVVFAGLDPDYARQYIEYYSSINPWIARAARTNAQGTESITTSEQLLAFSEFKQTEFYNDFASHCGTVHQIGGIISRRNDWCSAVTVCRTPKAGPFGPAEVELLRALFPHFQRAMQFHRRMADLEGCFRASLDALDHLPTGVILMDDHGRILETNRAAKIILSQNDGLRTDNEGLIASTSNQTKELRSSIAAAALTARGKGISAGGSLGIMRPSGKRPLVLVVMPASVHAFPPEAREPAVIVFVSDPETKIQTAPEVLARVYGLTAAESRLAEQLMQGESLVLAAERLGVSHNTARTHLQRIYQKTDTSHQADLVRVLLSGSLRA